MLRFMNRANALTLFGVANALSAALLALQGRIHWALVAMILAGLCDLFDGVLARSLTRTPLEERFGQRLDSLSDAVSFGACGALILFAAGLRSPYEAPLVIAFALAAVWRLAYFDAVGMEERPEGEAPRFVGLPTTYVALILPLAGLARLHSHEALRWTMLAAGALTALTMVSPLRIPKPGRRSYPAFLLLALALGALHLLAAAGRLGSA